MVDSAALVDPVVERRLLQIVTPEQIELAVAAAGELTERGRRALRSFELRVERARYQASRAKRAFDLCEPEIGLSPAASNSAGKPKRPCKTKNRATADIVT